MSTRLTHHRRSLSDRLNAWLEVRANDRMMAAAQRAEDALAEARHTIRTLQAQHARAMENMRSEYDAARESLERDLERELEVGRRLCEMAGYHPSVALSLAVTVEEDWQAADLVADAEETLRRAFPDPEAFLAHPSNGGEG